MTYTIDQWLEIGPTVVGRVVEFFNFDSNMKPQNFLVK